jgi:hypothetical protein
VPTKEFDAELDIMKQTKTKFSVVRQDVFTTLLLAVLTGRRLAETKMLCAQQAKLTSYQPHLVQIVKMKKENVVMTSQKLVTTKMLYAHQESIKMNTKA